MNKFLHDVTILTEPVSDDTGPPMELMTDPKDTALLCGQIYNIRDSLMDCATIEPNLRERMNELVLAVTEINTRAKRFRMEKLQIV